MMMAGVEGNDDSSVGNHEDDDYSVNDDDDSSVGNDEDVDYGVDDDDYDYSVVSGERNTHRIHKNIKNI